MTCDYLLFHQEVLVLLELLESQFFLCPLDYHYFQLVLINLLVQVDPGLHYFQEVLYD